MAKSLPDLEAVLRDFQQIAQSTPNTKSVTQSYTIQDESYEGFTITLTRRSMTERKLGETGQHPIHITVEDGFNKKEDDYFMELDILRNIIVSLCNELDRLYAREHPDQ